MRAEERPLGGRVEYHGPHQHPAHCHRWLEYSAFTEVLFI